MYIPPFIAGILFTLLFELLILMIAAYRNYQQRNDKEE